MSAQAAPTAGTVLIVDDTPANIHLLSEHLERHGLTVYVAQDGEEGVDRARSVLPDLVLLDVQMPGIDGFEACRRLRADELTRDIPVIFMTVISDTETKLAAFDAGAVDYVTKPFALDEVLARVNTQLRLMRAQRLLVEQNARLQHEAAVRFWAESQVRELNTDLEARVRQRTAELEAATRDLQAFCNSVAHDLRGPLASIDGYSSLLSDMLAAADDTRARHFLGRIRTGVRHMDALTDALLMLGRLSLREIHPGTVDLGALARAAVEVRRGREPQRAVDLAVQPDLQVTADGELLRLLVDQLVDNAWKFTADTPGPRIEVGRLVQAGGEPAFYVRDNGPGVDMAYADKLFRPFQRLHTRHDLPGVGVGLATVGRIASRHGGRAWAQSDPDRGMTVYFTLAPGARA